MIPASSITGSALSGTFSVTPGTASAVNAIIATFTIVGILNSSISWGVVMTPANVNSAGVSDKVYSIVSATNQFTLVNGGSALTTGTQYVWNYQIIGAVSST